jgi:hypothetical protein
MLSFTTSSVSTIKKGEEMRDVEAGEREYKQSSGS